jgi:hypothetical protein
VTWSLDRPLGRSESVGVLARCRALLKHTDRARIAFAHQVSDVTYGRAPEGQNLLLKFLTLKSLPRRVRYSSRRAVISAYSL